MRNVIYAKTLKNAKIEVTKQNNITKKMQKKSDNLVTNLKLKGESLKFEQIKVSSGKLLRNIVNENGYKAYEFQLNKQSLNNNIKY